MCLDDQILNTYLDGELTEPWKSQVEEHLSYCKSCKHKLEQLQQLDETLKSAELSQEEIQSHQDRVLTMLEKNVLGKKKKSIFKKQFKFSMPQLMGVAAAFVIVFVGAWSAGSARSNNVIAMPEVNSSIDISSITPVKAQETKSLDSYSLDEIIKNLDSRGYDVDVRLKSITPVDVTAQN